MDLYIDKQNVLSLINARSHVLYPDCLKTIQKQLNVFFNFKKEELSKHDELMAWFRLLTSGVGSNNKQVFIDNLFPQRPLKSITANNFDSIQLSSFYLLNDDDINKLKNAGSVIVGSVGEEIDIFNQLFLHQEDYLFDKEFRIGCKEFNKWEDISKYATPLTDIIVIDPFILKNSEVQTNTIDVNLVHLLSILCSKSKSKVNIVIVYNPKEVSYSINDVRDKIIKETEKELGKKPFVTFVKTFKEHDRTIITNYIRFFGNSFNYWNEDGVKITKGKEFFIKSLARNDFHNNAIEAISDLQNIIDFAMTNKGVEGDKVSNYLKF